MSSEKRPDMPGVQHGSAFETAAAWLQWLDRHPDDADSTAAFAQWQEASIENRETAARAMRTWRALGEVAGHPVVAAWRDQARKDYTSARSWISVAASVLLLLAGGTALLGYRNGEFQWLEVAQHGSSRGGAEDTGIRTESTALGELQHLVLTDGTKLTLNTASRVEIDYRGEQRKVLLLEGEAFFAVAKDPSRPFVVTAADRQVVALGTAFSVRLAKADVQVALLEGRVVVKPTRAPKPKRAASERGSSPEAINLEPGQQLIAGPEARAIVRSADVARITSWQDGWIIFNSDTIRDAVNEVSRYTRERITYDDARIAVLRVSGTFRTGEVEDFLDALAKVHPLTIHRPSADEARLVWAGMN